MNEIEVILMGNPKEIATLVLEIQERQRGALQIDVPSDITRMTAEEIAEMAHGPTLQEVMAHFGYESIGEWSSTWLNKPGQIDRLSELPEFIKTLGLDKRYRITFDYDPAYPKMLLQATASSSSQ